MSTIDSGDRAASLRAWAQGLLPFEAAVELLINSLDGRLLSGPWTRQNRDGGYWFDADLAAAESGSLSGGERRVLSVVTSLASSDHPVDLGDAITGIDGDALRHVLDALAHAGGLSAFSDLTPSGTRPPCRGPQAHEQPAARSDVSTLRTRDERRSNDVTDEGDKTQASAPATAQAEATSAAATSGHERDDAGLRTPSSAAAADATGAPSAPAPWGTDKIHHSTAIEIKE